MSEVDKTVELSVHEYSPGKFVLEPSADADPAAASRLLSHSLVDWQLQNPDRRVHCAVGIVSNGNTIAIHLWADTPPITDAR